jgi:hypothetical protein
MGGRLLVVDPEVGLDTLGVGDGSFVEGFEREVGRVGEGKRWSVGRGKTKKDGGGMRATEGQEP